MDDSKEKTEKTQYLKNQVKNQNQEQILFTSSYKKI